MMNNPNCKCQPIPRVNASGKQIGWTHAYGCPVPEIETRQRENLAKPTRDYPGASQMMAYQRLK